MSTRVSRGVSLVELIVFIVIVGIAMAGLFAAFNTITAASADPQVRKQVLAIAESLMDEVSLMAFIFCDPDDANAATAINSSLGAGGCATMSEDTAMGPEGGETRYNAANPFDNVSDYHNAPIGPGIRDITGASIGGLDAYTATITITQAGLTSSGDAIAAADALKISILVQGPSGVSITLEGYRTRYQPRTGPGP